jgi:hypothetical protein
MNHMLCESGNDDEGGSDYNDVEKACAVPFLYDYSYGTIVANCSVPDGGRNFYRYYFKANKIFQVELKGFKVNSAKTGVQTADKNYFQ